MTASIIILSLLCILSNAHHPLAQSEVRLLNELKANQEALNSQYVNRYKQHFQKMYQLADQLNPYGAYANNVLEVMKRRQNNFENYLSKIRRKRPVNIMKLFAKKTLLNKPRTDPLGRAMDYFGGQFNGKDGYYRMHKRYIEEEIMKGFKDQNPNYYLSSVKLQHPHKLKTFEPVSVSNY